MKSQQESLQSGYNQKLSRLMRDYEAVLLTKNQEIVELTHQLTQASAANDQMRRDLQRVSRLVGEADKRVAEVEGAKYQVERERERAKED